MQAETPEKLTLAWPMLSGDLSFCDLFYSEGNVENVSPEPRLSSKVAQERTFYQPLWYGDLALAEMLTA
jgi:hypothetical protein